MIDVAIVGGGPAGLAAAIAAQQHGLSYVVLEQGALVNSLMRFPTDMVFFTTPDLLEIGGLPFVSPHEKPTRAEALKYYRRVADTFKLEVRFEERVLAVAQRPGELGGGFVLNTDSRAHGAASYEAKSVVIASGAYDIPNQLGVPGEDLPHVSHFYKEPHPHYRRHVVIVGGKNSAAEAALDLYRNGAASVTIVHRHAALGESIKYWVKPDIENRIKEGSIAARFNARVVEITPTHVTVDEGGSRSTLPADAVYLLTGYRSDTSLLKSLGASVNDADGTPALDPEAFETTVPNVFVIGAAVAGKQSGKIFIENGRFHGAQAVKVIAGRLA
ncbi:MAG: YpdA family putative bacillithiol disulfide reductase [Acidobacteria bacterium]|nr:MAG: YpdA family putative bacillithiol disulfide reductase [Acidobacteriota bacterium]